MLITNTRDLATAYRHGPYAWPGGYPAYLILADGERLCWGCFRAEYGLIAAACREPGSDTQWEPYGLDVLWEDAERCAHCGNPLESAYEPATP